MPLTLICRAAAVAVCLAFALPAWGDEHEAAPPTSAETADEAQAPDEAAAPAAPGQAAGQAQAQALIAAGRFVEALNILGPLISANAVDANTVFLYGLAAAGAAQLPGMPDDTRENLLNEAIGAFRTMLIEEPRLLRVRLELARAFYLKGEEELARRHFELVLAADPPEAVVVNVRRFLAELQSRRRWSYRLGAALAPDSNIGGSSEERTIYIFNLPFERDVEELTTSGIGVSVWGGAEYHYPLAQDLRLRAGAEFARRGVRAIPFRSALRRDPSRPPLADRQKHGAERARQRPPALGRHRARRSRARRPSRGGAPRERARHGIGAGVLARAPLPHPRLPRRADPRCRGARQLGGHAHRAARVLRRLRAAAPEDAPLPHPHPLAGDRRLGEPAARASTWASAAR